MVRVLSFEVLVFSFPFWVILWVVIKWGDGGWVGLGGRVCWGLVDEVGLCAGSGAIGR